MGMMDWLRNLGRHNDLLAEEPTRPPTNGRSSAHRAHDETRSTTANSSRFFATEPPSNVTAEEAREMVVGGLDFFEAIKAHQRWKGRLIAQLDGTSTEKLDYRVVCRDDQCVLGKWINGAGAQAYGMSQNFNVLKVHHAQFHLAAGEIVRLHQERRQVEAQNALRHGDYARYSVKVQGLISTLYMEVKGVA